MAANNSEQQQQSEQRNLGGGGLLFPSASVSASLAPRRGYDRLTSSDDVADHQEGAEKEEEDQDLDSSSFAGIGMLQHRPSVRISVSGPSPTKAKHEDDTSDSADIASVRRSSRTSRRSRFLESVEDLAAVQSRVGSLRSLEGKEAGSGAGAGLLQAPGEYNSKYREEDDWVAQYAQPPTNCHSTKDVALKSRSCGFVATVLLAAWSTVFSITWLVAASVPFGYQGRISYGSSAAMTPAGAQLLATIGAKSIELSFVTVTVTVIGQLLTRRAFAKGSKGISIAEMSLRNWILQPGSIATHYEVVPKPLKTRLGAMSLIAAFAALTYTTASDALVSPKLATGKWAERELRGFVTAAYANVYLVRDSCATPIDVHLDNLSSSGSCLDVQYSGQSYRNLMAFMGDWQRIVENPDMANDTLLDIGQRPNGRHNLFDNTTLVSSWLDAEFGDIGKNFADHGRIIHQVTLAMPHPGVYAAATDPENGILQPRDLGGVGEYSIHASVVSPTVDVLCANMNQSELDPLVYTSWPDARTTDTKVPGQKIGLDDWQDDVPAPGKREWLNKTAVDDIFGWGSKYGRWPPVFQLFPNDWNMLVNDTTRLMVGDEAGASDSMYMLAKSGLMDDYTLCQLRSWVSPLCSTQFDVAGSTGHMRVRCNDSDAGDSDSYLRHFEDRPHEGELETTPSPDWRNLAVQWRMSMDLNGGTYNNNASNARILTHLVLQEPSLNRSLPSIAEALAVYSSSTLVAGSVQSPFEHFWGNPNYNETYKPAPIYQTFAAKVRTQQYASSGIDYRWKVILYAVLVAVVAVNGLCAYILVRSRALVTDYTEMENMFALAINSPPSRVLYGSCGPGPEKHQMTAPFRIAYAASANHYYYQEAPDRFKARHSALSSRSDVALLADGAYDKSYKRLSSTRPLL